MNTEWILSSVMESLGPHELSLANATKLSSGFPLCISSQIHHSQIHFYSGLSIRAWNIAGNYSLETLWTQNDRCQQIHFWLSTRQQLVYPPEAQIHFYSELRSFLWTVWTRNDRCHKIYSWLSTRHGLLYSWEFIQVLSFTFHTEARVLIRQHILETSVVGMIHLSPWFLN